MRILVLPGDGIGPEITAATVAVLRAAARRFALDLDFTEDVVGHASLQRHGTTLRPELLALARACDGLVLGPTATLDFKDPGRGEINPSMAFRKHFDLFANIRPARTYPGLPARNGEFDLVIARENTEGFYADRNMAAGNGEILVTADTAIAIRRITRACCRRIARTAFELARIRRKQVTIVHKANVLRVSDGLFLEECRGVAADFPDVAVDDILVDAMMAHVVRNPGRFDVIVTTNMFGDILSDLTAELSGSIGLGSALNAGADFAMAQAAHGSAPDIAGRNIANPVSLILSASQLLAWHGRRSAAPGYLDAAAAIDRAVSAAIAAGETTRDIGGPLGTEASGDAIVRRIGG